MLPTDKAECQKSQTGKAQNHGMDFTVLEKTGRKGKGSNKNGCGKYEDFKPGVCGQKPKAGQKKGQQRQQKTVDETEDCKKDTTGIPFSRMTDQLVWIHGSVLIYAQALVKGLFQKSFVSSVIFMVFGPCLAS